MTRWDVAIIGAGPAGGAAAYHLARRGHRVLVLEKEPFPRVKPCGGGVAPQVGRWFDFSFDPVISARVTRVAFTLEGADPVADELGTAEPFWMVRRPAFDAYLADRAVAAGAEVRTGCALTGLRRAETGWELATTAGVEMARLLLGADGAKGPTAKWLGFERKARLAGALEGEAPGAPGETSTVHFDFGSVPGGYQWAFPKADGWSVGSGVFRGRPLKDLRSRFEAYCGILGLDPNTCEVQGHPLLLWDGDQALHAPGALLAGEAACLVDPFTAEGIRPALRSGVLAAEALDRVLAGEAWALAEYTSAVHRELGAEFRWARRLARAFYRFPALGYRAAVKHPGGPRRMAQIITGERTYQEVAKRALARLFGGV